MEWDELIVILEWIGFILKLVPFVSFFGYVMDFAVEAFLFIKNDNYSNLVDFLMLRDNYPTNDSFLYHFELYWKDLENIRYYECLQHSAIMTNTAFLIFSFLMDINFALFGTRWIFSWVFGFMLFLKSVLVTTEPMLMMFAPLKWNNLVKEEADEM